MLLDIKTQSHFKNMKKKRFQISNNNKSINKNQALPRIMELVKPLLLSSHKTMSNTTSLHPHPSNHKAIPMMTPDRVLSKTTRLLKSKRNQAH
jgi:hypothetical protein